MEIDTGDVKQRARRMPFVMQSEVFTLCRGPRASPAIMVRKRDGSHRFCMNYQELNSLTKLDTFPLPRIDELLHYFSTLDLASRYWQIRMHPDSVGKMAFVTPQGLYEF